MISLRQLIRSYNYETYRLATKLLADKTVASIRRNLISFSMAAAMASAPCCLFGAPQVSLARLLVEKGYTPLTLKRAGNSFCVSCKLNGRSTSLVVDTGARGTVIGLGTLKALGVPLTKVEGNIFGVFGLAATS